MARIHAEKRRLCDMLEAIADTLPSRVDRLECLKAAGELVPLLRECHRFEEETLFPAFLAAGGREDIVARLKAEHVEDQGAAQELAEELFRIGHGHAVHNPEALGYLLRAFFESVRRHMAFEHDHVLPATRERG